MDRRDLAIRWFGENWGAPICEHEQHVDVPVGQPCGRCEEPIEAGDRGVMIPHLGSTVEFRPYHLNCHLRTVIGSVAHIEKRCGCHVPNATEGDDPDLTRRQAADAAVEAWRKL